MLYLKDIHLFYNKVEALKGISLSVEEGDIVSIVGSNGAGKTTILKTITGLLRPSMGVITLNGKNITGMPAHLITRLELSMVPEGRIVFPDLSVEDNLVLGGYHRYFGVKKTDFVKDIDEQYQRFPILGKRRTQLAGTLSGGEQQMLAISRALMARPKFLLLDEPSLGLAPVIIKDIFKTIEELNRTGTTILLVEQMASFALAISTRAYVLDLGTIKMEGSGKELIENPEVKRAYLGG
jgi:branched-chain amino acid transport system ATP-binding protein